MRSNRLFWLSVCAATLTWTLACSLSITRREMEDRNLALDSNLKKEYPGYVDGVTSAIGSGVGGGGGPGLEARGDNRLTITLDGTYRLERMILFAGCNDGETMDGRIQDLAGDTDEPLALFEAVGCGDVIPLKGAQTGRLTIMMTGGGGDDTQISIQEIEIYGR